MFCGIFTPRGAFNTIWKDAEIERTSPSDESDSPVENTNFVIKYMVTGIPNFII